MSSEDIPTPSAPSEPRPVAVGEVKPAAPAPKGALAGAKYPIALFANVPQNIALLAFSLGIVFTTGLQLATAVLWTKAFVWSASTEAQDLPAQSLLASARAPMMGAYLSCWATFHMLEFVVTAKYNAEKLSVSSFLLDNGHMYHIAHACGMLEFILEDALLPPQWRVYKRMGPLFLLGFCVLLVGQTMRSGAMIHASESFSHVIAQVKVDSHRLVTDGIYSWSRHPSYAGFVWWALGTQIMLANPIGFAAFAVTLYRFFEHRITVEERFLCKFFGKEYESYRARVPTRIAFIR